jgi:hypothetical protein
MRLLNVFATPGEVFDEVKGSQPSSANWLVPTLLALLVGIISIFIIYSQPAILQKIHEQQTKVIDDQVKAGKTTQAQADQEEAVMARFGGPTIMIFAGSIGVVVVIFARVFWWALVLWLLGKWFLKAGFSYQQSLETAGLASSITILSGLVMTLLTVCLGKITSLSLALCNPNADPGSLVHMLLTAVDFFELWVMGVLAVGLARLSGASMARAFSLTFGYWLVMTSLLVSLGWFFAHLSTGFK